MPGRVAAIVVVLVAIAGCRETQHCQPGWSYQNGECLPRGGQADSGPRPDAGMDGSTDAAVADVGNDAGHDGGPCDLCTADEMCLTSLPDAGADGGTDAGAITLPRCVECVSDTVCMVRGVDAGMTADAGAAATRGAPICEGYRCILGCRSDADCGGNACRADHTCSAYSGMRDVCLPCDTDANCLSGRCVSFANGGHGGAYCLSTVAEFGACSGRRRFTGTLTSVATVDGVAATDYCVPANAVTCEAVLAFGTTCGPALCGAIAGTETGSCVSGHCTYPCDNAAHGNSDCPSGHTCPSATSQCL